MYQQTASAVEMSFGCSFSEGVVLGEVAITHTDGFLHAKKMRGQQIWLKNTEIDDTVCFFLSVYACFCAKCAL